MENTHIKNEETMSVTSNSETATVAASSGTDNNAITAVTSSDSVDNIVNSSTNIDSSSSFQPFEQLHEAVLAAVNSHGMPPGFMEAAVAAAAAGVTNNTMNDIQTKQQVDNMEYPHVKYSPEVDYMKKESVRASNRERKKKWRIHNEERNKDNDLRCRVNKRANKLHGPGESEEKTKWIQEEFEKRRQKRMDKERRKHIVNNVLSVPGSGSNNGIVGDTSSDTGIVSSGNANSSAVGNNDSTDNLISNIGSAQLSNYYAPLPQIDTDTANKLLDFPTDLQRQLLEQLNNSMLALANGMQQQQQQHQHQQHQEGENNINKSSQPDEDTIMKSADSNEQLQQAITQSMSSNTSVTSNSEHNSPMQFTTTNLNKEDSTTATTTITPEDENVDGTNNDGSEGGGKKPEYPMDAVLTLMQLNAGWRQ